MATTEYYDDYNDSSALSYSDNLAGPCSLQDTWQFGQWFCPAVYSLIFLLAVVGNGLVLCVVQRYRHSRSGPCAFSLTDTFLLHLAVSDLLLALTLPFYAVQWASDWPFGLAACKVASAAFSLNVYSGILFLACISFDRYLAIVHAVSVGWRRNTCHAQIACAIIWVVCLSLAAVDIKYSDVVMLPGSTTRVCQLALPNSDSENWQVSLQLVSMVVGFGLPLLVMLYCYVRIFRALCHATRHQKRKSLRLIVSLVSIFLLCWGPYNSFRLVDSLQRLSVIDRSCSLEYAVDVGTLVSESVGLAHCAFNPLLYVFVGVKFRRELVDMWKELLASFGFLGLGRWGQERHRGKRSFSSESENTSYFSVVM